jgi:type VI protein secretion system component Hcp
MISSYQLGAHNGGSLPTEQFAINFTKIKTVYKPQNADGTMAAPIELEYDVKKQQGK